jgi:cytochrome P450
MAVLMAQPLLNSVFNETMRHYVDCLVTRQLETDMVVDGYLLRKGDLVMAPSSLSQHDTMFWERNFEPSADTWCAERFIRHDETPGKQGGLTSSTSWCGGKFFPFGGGSHACPGRVFAKQKILGAVAAFLMQFDVEFVEFLGTDRKGNVVSLGTEESAFPKVKQQYAGNGTLAMDGDIRVRIRRR